MYIIEEKRCVKNRLLTRDEFIQKKCKEFNKKNYRYEIYIDANEKIYSVYEYIHKHKLIRRISSYDFKKNIIVGAKTCSYELYKKIVLNTMLAYGKDGETLFIQKIERG